MRLPVTPPPGRSAARPSAIPSRSAKERMIPRHTPQLTPKRKETMRRLIAGRHSRSRGYCPTRNSIGLVVTGRQSAVKNTQFTTARTTR